MDRPRSPFGAAASKNYQIKTPQGENAAPEWGMAIPQSVAVAMADIAAGVREGLAAGGGGGGGGGVRPDAAAMLEESVTTLAGRAVGTTPIAVRHGTEAGPDPALVWSWSRDQENN